MNRFLPDNIPLPKTHNGIPVKWWISEAVPAWIDKRNEGLQSNGWENSRIWYAYASCNGRAYQLDAFFDKHTGKLEKIGVNNDPKNYYYHRETCLLLGAKPKGILNKVISLFR